MRFSSGERQLLINPPRSNYYCTSGLEFPLNVLVCQGGPSRRTPREPTFHRVVLSRSLAELQAWPEEEPNIATGCRHACFVAGLDRRSTWARG